MLPRFFVFLALLAVATVRAEPARVGIVDVDVLFREYHVAKAKRGSIESLRQRVENDPRIGLITGLKGELTALKARLEDPQTLASEKEALARDFEMKGHEINSLQREIRQHMASEQAKLDEELVNLTRELLAQIRAEIAAYAEAGGFDLVFEKSGKTSSQVPTLIYCRHGVDITEAVLARLNRDQPQAGGGTEISPVSSQP